MVEEDDEARWRRIVGPKRGQPLPPSRQSPDVEPLQPIADLATTLAHLGGDDLAVPDRFVDPRTVEMATAVDRLESDLREARQQAERELQASARRAEAEQREADEQVRAVEAELQRLLATHGEVEAQMRDRVDQLDRAFRTCRRRLPSPARGRVDGARAGAVVEDVQQAVTALSEARTAFVKGRQFARADQAAARALATRDELLRTQRRRQSEAEAQVEQVRGEARERIQRAQAQRAADDEDVGARLRAHEAQIARLLGELAAEASDMTARAPALLSAWDAPTWDLWTPAETVPDALRVGEHTYDNALAPEPIRLPAVLGFPRDRSLVVSHGAGGRAWADSVLRSLLLRLIAAMPPGSYQLALADPVGLGDTFSSFLHLQELDPSTLSGRVASQPEAIEQMLDDAIVHIETVTQQYLRSAFPSLREYNEAAGEVAERFRFLAVANYPSGFDARLADKLRSVLQRGPRCGLFTIVTGGDAPGEYGVPALPELGSGCIQLIGSRDGGVVHSPQVECPPLALRTDPPPPLILEDDGVPQSLFGQILVGAAVVGRGRSTQPVTLARCFEILARSSGWRDGAAPSGRVPVEPEQPQTWWQGSSAERIATPIGRSGAREACVLAFDSRAASGALVVGAPGMGKTTLLHAVILGACMQYGPEELELYLLDSKQGVEFKVYADLPHARAIAIRNEREFGVSVLQGLRDELDRRAAAIKASTSGGEVDLPGFRRATGEPMPRVLLVADEFHELFERVDRLGQQAAELLDDLIRQGRSYGIHVLLGSQTLEGTDALPKHVPQLTQTRIAFQCREQDAATVMRDDNRDVFTLSGPGDGLFNPDRGAPAANQRFQGALVEPRERVALARALRDHATASGFDRHPIVFDGDAAFALDELAPEEFSSPAARLSLRLGEPCAISDAVRVELPRRPGGNLLAVVDESTGRSLVHVALAAAHRRADITVLDLTGEDDPVAEAFWDSGKATLVRRRRAGAELERVAKLVEERASLDEYRSRAELLVVTGVKAMRNPDEPIAGERSFNDLLDAILRDGPEVGVHAILIADSLPSVERRLPHGAMSECAVRLVTRVSSDDSRRLLDSSEEAAALRPHQGVLFDDGDSRTVRLRCYRPAGARWVQWASNSATPGEAP